MHLHRKPSPSTRSQLKGLFGHDLELIVGTIKCKNKFQAILFYGSNFNFTDIPMPRRPTVPWILFHEESPKNQPVFSYASAISVFNATATFSRYSNFPLTLQYLTDANALLDHSYFQTVSRKNELQQDDQLASVVYVQSICNTMSGRDEYVQELMKFINIDSYGLCLNNKPMPFK